MSQVELNFKYSIPTAVLGGGTGQFNLLRGIVSVNNPELITAIPGTGDSGGSTGRLRTELGLLPPGDARRCVVALMANDRQREIALQLFEERVEGFSHLLDGHSVGNLIIGNLDRKNQGQGRGLDAVRDLFLIRSKIAPLTLNSLTLIAKTKSGIEIEGEEQIDHRWQRPDFDPDDFITHLYYSAKPQANPEAINAVKNAKVKIFSMGSLFGSILPHLLVPEIRNSIIESEGDLYFIMNMMTERGQTDAFEKASDHLKPFVRYLGDKNRLNYIIVNDNNLDPEILHIYKDEGQVPVELDEEECLKVAPKARILKAHLANYNHDYHLLRHDPEKIADVIYNPAKYFTQDLVAA